MALDALTSLIRRLGGQNSHISSLHKELKEVRQAYLSAARPRAAQGRWPQGQPRVLTDREREEVDVNAKQMIRELNASIRALDEAEVLRRETETAVIRKQQASGLSLLGSWASGGGPGGKTEEAMAQEARAQQTELHRDGILWFLRRRLELCCRTQQEMMETRLSREMGKTRGLGLAAPPPTDFADFAPTSAARPRPHPPSATRVSGEASGDGAGDGQLLTEQQVQMFEQDNQDMMKHYESTLDKVK